MWTPSYAVDILAVSRLINGTIYREKTEIINPWGVRRPPPQPSLNDAPATDIRKYCYMIIEVGSKQLRIWGTPKKKRIYNIREYKG